MAVEGDLNRPCLVTPCAHIAVALYQFAADRRQDRSSAPATMPKADARLYAALLRAGRRFRSAGMPLLGVAGTDVVCWDLSWPATVRRELQAPPPGVGLAGEHSGQGRKLVAPLQLNFCRMSACSWRPNRSAWPATLATSACPPHSPCTWLAAEGAQALSMLQRQLGLLLQAEEHTREVRHLCECCLCRAAMLLV